MVETPLINVPIYVPQSSHRFSPIPPPTDWSCHRSIAPTPFHARPAKHPATPCHRLRSPQNGDDLKSRWSCFPHLSGQPCLREPLCCRISTRSMQKKSNGKTAVGARLPAHSRIVLFGQFLHDSDLWPTNWLAFFMHVTLLTAFVNRQQKNQCLRKRKQMFFVSNRHTQPATYDFNGAVLGGMPLVVVGGYL